MGRGIEEREGAKRIHVSATMFSVVFLLNNNNNNNDHYSLFLPLMSSLSYSREELLSNLTNNKI